MKEQIIDDSLRGSAEAKYAWPHSAAYQNISEDVRKITVPTLVLVGDQDPQDPERQQREELLPLLGDVKLELLSDCGHLAPIERPELLAKAVGGWLSGLIPPDMSSSHQTAHPPA